MTPAKNNEAEHIEFNLDGEICALIVSLCSRRNMTPGALLGEAIREEADKHGLLKKRVRKSA